MLLASMLFTSVYGWVVERIAYRPLRGSSRLAPLISAIGVSIFLQNYVQLIQGARNKSLQPILPGNPHLLRRRGLDQLRPLGDDPADGRVDVRLHHDHQQDGVGSRPTRL